MNKVHYSKIQKLAAMAEQLTFNIQLEPYGFHKILKTTFV